MARGVGITRIVQEQQKPNAGADRPKITTCTYALTEFDLPGDVAVPVPMPGSDYAWFFPNPPAEYPAAPPIYHDLLAQRFERGLILYRPNDRTFVVFIDDALGRDWTFAGDGWVSGMVESDPNIVPPPGFYQPKRGFGLLWREGVQGPPLRDRLGWATSEEIP